MKDKACIMWVYAALLLVGGFIGFLQANSWPSLFMGSIFAGILARYAYGIWQNELLSFKMTIGNLVFLFIFFGYRLYVTHKMMPAGMMMIITILVLNYLWFKKPNPMTQSNAP